MLNQFSRTQLLFGEDGMEKLRRSRVAVFGVGGVGGYAVEALARSGIGALDLIDDDRVCLTNLNRQLHATRKTVGHYKVDAAEERIREINPDCAVRAYKTFYMPDTQDQFDFSQYDYVIDAIDSVNDKVDLIIYASRVRGCKVFSSMGAALRFDPTQVTTGELFSIKGDALAKAVRARMKRLDLKPYKKIRCVYSLEQAQRCETRGSLMQVTAVFGCTLASLIIRDLL